MKRKSFEKADCPVARALDAIGDWWSLLIIRDSFDGVRRFGDFQKNLGIAKNILAERLRSLAEHGILEIVPASDGSAYQEYALTEKGQSLFYVIVSLRQWGEEYFFTSREKHSVLIDQEKRHPVPKLELRAKSGKLLTAKNTLVKKVVR
jgi:DNA-binding HxlR family transcriptional regulator